ncbi:MAG: hypothetical protein KAU10_02580 [Dehalococcoidia bacterium]|nr:hypothetical protein [Dehalococcoidia bacterium]
MKRLSLIILMGLLLVASSTVFAASARWNALGGEHRFMLDTSNYAIYPGRMLQFADALWIIPNIPAGQVPDNMMSGLLVKKDDCAWAIHYNLPGAVGFTALRAALPTAGGNLPGLAGSLRPFPDLFLAKKMGDMTVGGRVVLGIAGSENALEEAASAMSVDAAVGVTKPIALGDVDLGARVHMASFSDDAPAAIASTGGIGVNVDARLIMDKGDGKKLIPVLGVRYSTDPVVDGATEASDIGVNIGCGVNKRGADKSMLVTGVVLDVNMNTTSPPAGDVSVTTITATYLGGYEKPLNSWLIGRGGASATLTMVSGDNTAANGKTAAFAYNFGVRATYKKVLVDLLLSQGLLHNGPYVLSGTATQLATNVCLTYLF